MKNIGTKVIKYVLWIVLVVILSLLLVGLIKYRGDVYGYVRFLNTRDRNQARHEIQLSHPSTIAAMFWGEGADPMAKSISGEILTGIDITADTGTPLIDPYDPDLEAELDGLSTGEDTSEFGFSNTGALTPSSGEENTQLINLIKQRELKK